MIRIMIFSTLAISFFTTHLKAMEKEQPLLQSIHEVPAHYAKFAQSIVDGSRKCTIHYKRDLLGHFHKVYVSELENPQDGEINQILTLNAQSIYNDPWLFRYQPGGKYISLHSYDFRTDYDSADSENYTEEIKETIKDLTLFCKTRCSEKELEYVYGKIIEELRKNWEYLGSCWLPDGDAGLLFTKENSQLYQEDLLLQSLAKKFHMKDSVYCARDKQGIVLKVDRNSWEKFKRIFDLEIFD